MRPRGVSLVEVMVAGSLLFMLSMVLYWVMRYAHADQRKHSSATTGQRAVSQALNRIEQILLTARLSSPTVGSPADAVLVYDHVATDADGEMEILATGEPVWQGPARLAKDPTNHVLQVTETGQSPRVVANLGPQGEVSFYRLSNSLLEVRLRAEDTRPGDVTRSYRNEAVAQVYVQNQTP